MGPGKSEGVIFANVKEGKIHIKAHKDAEPEIFTFIEGYITGLKVVDKEYEGTPYRQLNVNLSDGAGKTWQLQLRLSSGYGRAFCKILPNIELTKPVSIAPSVKEVEGKKQYTVFVRQDDKALTHAFTKDNPGEMPPVEGPIKIKGVEHWDDSKQQEFFESLIESIAKHITPGKVITRNQNVSAANEKPSKSGRPTVKDDHANGNGHSDDLPF
jgi:hypothetical protein